MTSLPRSIVLRSESETARLARRFASVLHPGDCLLLEGAIGSGKTHFARHLIQSIQSVPEDVPSPTFTLVQTYQTTAGDLWHADLYRLTGQDEVEELGLEDALETAICLVEWPDRLGERLPADALHLTFSSDPMDEDMRRLVFAGPVAKWGSILGQVLHG